jgi:hypothetical protein
VLMRIALLLPYVAFVHLLNRINSEPRSWNWWKAYFMEGSFYDLCADNNFKPHRYLAPSPKSTTQLKKRLAECIFCRNSSTVPPGDGKVMP